MGEYIENMTSILQSHDEEIKNISSTLSNMAALLGNIANLLSHQLIINQRQGPPARDCQDATIKAISTSGSYMITPQDGLGSLDVYCDMETNSGGWTVLQKRFDGSLDFYQSWQNYENGFGRADGEYWLGLKNIRRLVSVGRNWTLRIDLEASNGDTAYAEYESFMIGDAASNYVLSVGTYSGNAGDALNQTSPYTHNGMPFSTMDRDNDHSARIHCAEKYKQGWWLNACIAASVNGLYSGASIVGQGIGWFVWKGWEQLKKSEMKIRHEQ